MKLKGKYFKRIYKDNYIIVKGITNEVSPLPTHSSTFEIVFESVPWGTGCVGKTAALTYTLLIPMTKEEVMLELL